MYSTSLVRQIETDLKKEHNVAVAPDFPHLISAPDILIGGKGRLCGVFILKSYEATKPDQLLSRLVLSRLGLPDNMISILVVEQNELSPQTEHDIKQNFDFILTSKETRNIKEIVESNYLSRKLETETRHRTIARYSRFYIENQQKEVKKTSTPKPLELFHELQTKGEYQSTKSSNWNMQQKIAKNRVTEGIEIRDNINLFASTFEHRASPLKNLKDFCLHSVKFDYVLDSGVPYIQTPKINILLVDKAPFFRLDPEKPLRSAAFAGLVLSQAEGVNEIEYLSDRLEKSLGRIK